MRKFVSIAIMTVFVFVSSDVLGQGYTFRVLANKGQNKVKKAGSSAAVALKTGATLSDGDELITSQGAYIGLMHRTGKTLEVRTAGVKKVTDLEKLVNTKASSVTSRYAKFLANKMNEKETTNYRARLNATGAVSRALTGNEAINPLVPVDVNGKPTDVLGDKAVIRWESPEGIEDNTFIVSVLNIFDEELLKEEVTGNKITLDFASPQLQNKEGLYLVNIIAKENQDVKSTVIPINKLNAEDASKYSEGYTSLTSEIADDSPLNKVIYAGFYEENGLVLDALTKIEEAIEMSPEVEDFKEIRTDIRLRNGIAKKEEIETKE